MNFDELYKDVPDSQKNALKAFRGQNPLKELNGWNYISAGQGAETILWLVGGLKKADAAFQTIPLMADNFRIIAPDYPALSSMDALADGLAEILEAENIESAHVLSGSFGGMLGQVFLRRYPSKVKKLVLSTTTAPDTVQIERYQQLYGMASAAPEEMLRELAPSQMFGTIAPPAHEADFYRAYLKELYGERLNKADILSTYEAIIDYMKRDFSVWESDNLLILKSDNDATFGEAEQAKLIALYPNAQTHTFTGAGHSPSSTQREAYFAKVREFFSKNP
jgi:pimeloyl-ACP methyl ester carboxylesterase